MTIKMFDLVAGFLSTKDNIVNIYCPVKNDCFEYFFENDIEENNLFVFQYTNTFNNTIFYYIENMKDIKAVIECDGNYIEATFFKGKQIDKKEYQTLKRKMIIKNLLT